MQVSISTSATILIFIPIFLVSIAFPSACALAGTSTRGKVSSTGGLFQNTNGCPKRGHVMMTSSSTGNISDGSNEEPTTVTPPLSSSSRRNFVFLASSALAATATQSLSQNPLLPNINIVNNSPGSKVKSMSIAQAVQWIDDKCDRRFLHAVIASDYRFLYRGVSGGPNGNVNTIPIETQRLSPDLLTEGTYGNDSTGAAALELFQNLQEVLKDDAVNPSNGHLATSSINDAGQWGVAASIWPVDGAHYAWFQDKELFYPRPSVSATVTSNTIRRDELIVDGKDCGKESLEDALRAESCEVMVASEEFLVVPAALDESLRDALVNSFLI